MSLPMATLRGAVTNQLRNRCHNNLGSIGGARSLPCSWTNSSLSLSAAVQVRPIFSDNYLNLGGFEAFLKRENGKSLQNKSRVEAILRKTVESQNTKGLFLEEDMNKFNRLIENL